MTERGNSSGVLKSKEDIESYIRTRSGMLMVAYGKKENDTLIDIFVKHLAKFPYVALKGGFDKAEISFERFPTVKKITEMCGEFVPSRAWQYNFKPGVDQDGIAVLIDPNPSSPSARFMYKPQDCEEGLAYLAALKAIAEEGKRKKFIFPKREEAV